jgi:hypothetical protein
VLKLLEQPRKREEGEHRVLVLLVLQLGHFSGGLLEVLALAESEKKLNYFF